jgi:hypothetical protein
MVFLQSVQMLSLSVYVHNFHHISYTFICVSHMQYVIRLSWVNVVTSNGLYEYVFFISHIECSAHLPYVLQWAIHIFCLVRAISSVFFHLWVWLYYAVCCVSCSKCYSYLCLVKEFCNFLYFLFTICENGPFCFLMTVFCCVCVVLFFDVVCVVFVLFSLFFA